MTSTLHAFASGGHLVISFPEASVPPQEREDFIAFLKAEWTARQSRFSETDAKALADEGTLPAAKVAEAIKKYRIDTECVNPLVA